MTKPKAPIQTLKKSPSVTFNEEPQVQIITPRNNLRDPSKKSKQSKPKIELSLTKQEVMEKSLATFNKLSPEEQKKELKDFERFKERRERRERKRGEIREKIITANAELELDEKKLERRKKRLSQDSSTLESLITKTSSRTNLRTGRIRKPSTVNVDGVITHTNPTILSNDIASSLENNQENPTISSLASIKPTQQNIFGRFFSRIKNFFSFGKSSAKNFNADSARRTYSLYFDDKYSNPNLTNNQKADETETIPLTSDIPSNAIRTANASQLKTKTIELPRL